MTRQCGDCQLCCKLVPVAQIGKLANTKCEHQRYRKGCAIYERRPLSCAGWMCKWLADEPDMAALSRPDRVHYVIDVLPDYITITSDEHPPIRVRVEQVWVDKRFPNAHHDPALHDYLAQQGKHGIAALIRYDNKEGFVLFPPAMNDKGVWHEHHSKLNPEAEHSPSEVIDLIEQGVI